MEELSSSVKHRLELLERTVYALQAQQRLLEYRLQHAEDENKNLHQYVSSKLAHIDGLDSKKIPPQPYVQMLGSRPLHSNFFIPVEPYTSTKHGGENSKGAPIQFLEKEMASLSLLDAPNVLSTPTLTPARIASTSTIAKGLSANFSLTPTSNAFSESDPKEGNQKLASDTPTSALISISPNPDIANNVVSRSDETPQALESEEQKFAVVPWDGTIAWKFIRLFKDKKEEQEAMLNSLEECEVQNEWFFQFGLRYIPKPKDKDAYRTVRIENLPKDITLDKILAEIHYGDIFSANLLDTSFITGYFTARIVFLRQQSALKFCKYVKKKGFKVQGVQAYVTVEKTATYPVGMSLREAIWECNCTRCLTISEVPEALVASVDGIIHGKYLIDSVESVHKEHSDMLDQEGDLTKFRVRFYSMRAAVVAHKELQKNIFLRSCVIKYEKDPCNSEP